MSMFTNTCVYVCLCLFEPVSEGVDVTVRV